MSYDAWLCAEHERQEEKDARRDGIWDAHVRELLAGELDVMDYASENEINALFKALCAIAYKDIAPAIRINEIQVELSQFADDQGMTHAAEASAEEAGWSDARRMQNYGEYPE